MRSASCPASRSLRLVLKPPANSRSRKPDRPALQLALRQRVQPHDLHAARQRVGQLRQQQDIRRAGQEETAWRPSAVDRRLQRRKQGRHALNLVEDDPLGQVVHEAGRVGLGRTARHLIVEAEVRVAQTRPDRLRQRRLAALARPMDQHHGRVGQRLAEARRKKARIERSLGHRLIVRLAVGQLQVHAAAS